MPPEIARLRAAVERLECAIGSITDYKLPLNHHSRGDTADRLHYDTVRDAAALCEAVVRDSAGA